MTRVMHCTEALQTISQRIEEGGKQGQKKTYDERTEERTMQGKKRTHTEK